MIEGVKWLAKGLKAMFGVSEAEKLGREAGRKFIAGLEEALSSAQLGEAAAAGTAFASTHIAIRDALLAVGESLGSAELQAALWVRRLAQAQKAGPEAVAAVTASMMELVEAGRQVAERMDAIVKAVASIWEQAQEAGVSAYDEVYDASMRSGMGQAAAAAAAAKAQTAATAAGAGRRKAEIVCTHSGIRGRA